MTDEALQPSDNPPRAARSIWAAVLGAPALWALHLQLNYVLVEHLCQSKRVWVLHVITLVFLALTALGMGLASREWRRAGRESSPFEGNRTRFLAGLGILTSTLFFVVIAATGIPAFFIDPCLD